MTNHTDYETDYEESDPVINTASTRKRSVLETFEYRGCLVIQQGDGFWWRGSIYATYYDVLDAIDSAIDEIARL